MEWKISKVQFPMSLVILISYPTQETFLFLSVFQDGSSFLSCLPLHAVFPANFHSLLCAFCVCVYVCVWICLCMCINSAYTIPCFQNWRSQFCFPIQRSKFTYCHNWTRVPQPSSTKTPQYFCRRIHSNFLRTVDIRVYTKSAPSFLHIRIVPDHRSTTHQGLLSVCPVVEMPEDLWICHTDLISAERKKNGKEHITTWCGLRDHVIVCTKLPHSSAIQCQWISLMASPKRLLLILDHDALLTASFSEPKSKPSLQPLYMKEKSNEKLCH